MNDFLQYKFLNNSIEQWLISVAILVGTIIVVRIVLWIFKTVLKPATSKTDTRLDDVLIDELRDPVVFITALISGWYGLMRLHFTDEVDSYIGNAFSLVITLGVSWLLVRFVNALIEEFVKPKVEKSESDFDDQLLPIIQKLLIVVIWSLGILMALSNAGYNISTLIAGLGIGGLAFAMAAKDTVSNFFGGIMIFSDKPFKIYDRIKIGGFDGTVMEIGLRSTRLRTLEGRVVTIPNAKFIDQMVENVSLEPSRKVVMQLGLIYDTTPEQMQQAMDILADIHKSETRLDETVHIAFTSFGDFSLGITFIYYISKGENIFGVQSDINLEILKRFNEAGLEMAFPTQTVYTRIEGDCVKQVN